MEVVIDGITTNVKEQMRRKPRNCNQRKHATYLKGQKLRESIIKWKNQYELKQWEVETIKRINERITKEKEKIKRQFDRFKEQLQNDKQKEQQNGNEITKIS